MSIGADDACQAKAERARQERQPATHAEAGREERLGRVTAGRVELGETGSDVGGEGLPARLRHVGHEVEVRLSRHEASGPAEVVDRQGIDALLGEARRQLLEVRVQPARVRQDQDRCAGRLRRPGPER
jgi:hypothetical protein